jgi:hypothetical protein
LKKLSLIIFLLVQVQFCGLKSTHSSNQPVIALDLHCVAPNVPTATIVLKALPFFLCRHPSMVLHAYSISKYAIELSKHIKGISNVLHELNKQLETQKYGKLSDRELRRLLMLAVMAVPNKEVLEIIARLRAAGYKIIGMTNRDEHEFEAYKHQLKKSYKIDLDNFFDGFICAPAFDSFSLQQGPFKITRTNQLVASERLPGESFLLALRTLADSLNPTQTIYCVPTAYHSYFRALEKLDQQTIKDKWGIKNFLFSEFYQFMQWLSCL